MRKILLFSIFCVPFFCNALALKLFTNTDISKAVIGKSSTSTLQLGVTLNTLGFFLAKEGPGSPGNENRLFDTRLEKTIKGFQQKNQIPITGKLDLKTTQVLNNYILDYNKKNDEDSTTPSIDAGEYYAQDQDLSKDYFSGDEGKTGFFENGQKDNTTYFDSGQKEVTDYYGGVVTKAPTKAPVKTTSKSKIQSLLDSGTFSSPSKVTKNKVLSGLLENTTKGKGGILGTPSSLPQTKNVYTRAEIDRSIQSIMTDGRFDPFKCTQDPICSQL